MLCDGMRLRLLTAVAVAVVAAAVPATAASASPACVTSTAKGSCWYGTVPYVTGASDGVEVDQNVWHPSVDGGWHQTLRAHSPRDWAVTARLPAANWSVVSYPNVWAPYDGRVDSFKRVSSYFAVHMPVNPRTRGWAAYDLWYNNWGNEVMVQFAFASGTRCDHYVAHAVFGGYLGIPRHRWDLCVFGGDEQIWQLPRNEYRGGVPLLAMTRWLERHGYLPRHSTWTAISAGFELASTGGRDEVFGYSRFSVVAHH